MSEVERPPTSRWSPHSRIAILTAATTLVMASACSSSPDVSASCGGNRVVVVDLASSNRAPASMGFVTDVVSSELLGAAVCDEKLTVVGVAEGGRALIVSSDDVAGLGIKGPNKRARADNARPHQKEVSVLVGRRLARALEEFSTVRTTSVTALYAAAAEQAAGATRVVVLTPGVHQDGPIDLNRPLAPGEGASAASGIRVPKLPPGATVRVAGVGQVDVAQPAPGSTWTRELVSFNETVCEATSASCQIFTVASVSQIVA